MGQAKNRGTYEERKAQAIAEGRSKKPKESAKIKPAIIAHNLTISDALTIMQLARQYRG